MSVMAALFIGGMAVVVLVLAWIVAGMGEAEQD